MSVSISTPDIITLISHGCIHLQYGELTGWHIDNDPILHQMTSFWQTKRLIVGVEDEVLGNNSIIPSGEKKNGRCEWVVPHIVAITAFAQLETFYKMLECFFGNFSSIHVQLIDSASQNSNITYCQKLLTEKKTKVVLMVHLVLKSGTLSGGITSTVCCIYGQPSAVATANQRQLCQRTFYVVFWYLSHRHHRITMST